MSSLRSAIRNGIPFSTELYEYQDNRRRLARSRKQLNSLRESGRDLPRSGRR